MPASPDPRPLILHVVYRFDVGGLENGIVNLINHLPESEFRHAVVALTEVTAFARRVRRDDVEWIALGKPPGHAVHLYPRLYRLFRERRPAVVHTRNLAALEAAAPAWAARVPARIHGEHGRDVGDLDGANRRYRWARRAYRPFVGHYVALSGELERYLTGAIGVPAGRVTRICNGVDTDRFAPAAGTPAPVEGCPFDPARHWIVGTVGRMQAVKDQLTLARAFVGALELRPELRARMRLAMVGEGPLRAASETLLREAGAADLAWLPGERADVPQILQSLRCFALPSLAEGISNTILEAMACGLPVVATRVGGNADLVAAGRTGELVPPGDVRALAHCLADLAAEPERAARLGAAARREVEERLGLPAMVEAYRALYRAQIERAAPHGSR